MIGYFNSTDLPSLSYLIEYIPTDLPMEINPQELSLPDGHFIQEEMPVQQQEQSQFCDLLHCMYEMTYGSDGSTSCCFGEEIPLVSTHELFDPPQEEYSSYNDLYTWAAEAIRSSDTTPFAPPFMPPPFMLNTSIVSTLDNNNQPPICHADLDFSFEPFEPEIENPCIVNCSWEDNHYFNSDFLSVEKILSHEEVIVVEPKKKDKAKVEEKKTKRTRKNYSADTVDILMDWYLKHGGVVPTNNQKKILAGRTSKSEAQIGTWFHNAKRRYVHKLQLYKSLSEEHPDLVYNYRTLKSFLKMKK